MARATTTATSKSSKIYLDIARLEQRYATIRTGIRVIGILAGLYIAQMAVVALAGEETSVSLLISVLADVKFAFTLTLAGAAVAWAAVERHLRHRKVEQMQGRIKELELKLDPGRSSSGLTPQGKTNPGDKKK
ncbi:hypothetical protein [uncultured Nitratireductor sp.]|uniref:hypothetical protein n=1 Tax=uncultured Nitratireductor sp. TaxID=520953 RepID=UPI0025F148DD|nr:hypothetical protein [uncultured Nitratireductor sp.]